MLPFTLQPQNFFLGQQLIAAVLAHLFQLFQALNRFLDGRVIRQQAAQPAMVDVVHPAAPRLLRNGLLRLPLGPYKKQQLIFLRGVSHEFGGFLEEF